MDCVERPYRVKSFKKMTSVELEKDLERFINANKVTEIVSFNTTSFNSVGTSYLIGVLIYR